VNINTGLYPKIYFKIYARKYPFSYLAVNTSTDICIEGYPRCANSYAVYAFKLTNNKVNIGHHLHVPAQILRAVVLQIPTVVTIRNPQDAVASFLLFQNSTNADIYLKAYIKFYKAIVPLLDRLIVADFFTIIDNFNKVIHAINNKYRTNFQLVDDLIERQYEVFNKLEEINKRFFASDKNKMMYPNKTREIHKQKMKKYIEGSKFLEKARAIYDQVKIISV
jgi:hypothetical protein